MQINSSRFIVPTRPNKKKLKSDITTIILSGSLGYRSKSYGSKLMLKAENGKTILDNQVETINNVYPNGDIIVTTGIQSDKVAKEKPQQVRIVENQLYESTGEFEQLRLALNNCVTDEVIIVNGILFFDEQAIKELVTTHSFNILVHKDMMEEDEVGVTIVDDFATILSYSISKHKWCNMLHLKGKDLKIFRSIVNNRDNSKLMTFEAINMMLEKRSHAFAIQSESKVIIKLDGRNSINKRLKKK